MAQSLLGGPTQRGGVAGSSTMVGVAETQIISKPKSSVSWRVPRQWFTEI